MASINGIGGGLPGLGHPGLDERPRTTESEAPTREIRRSEADPRVAVGGAPVEGAAEGVDPELWGMLSRDERVFYLRNAMTGPLTYGPGAESTTSSSPRSRLGGRIDVRG